MVRTNPLSGVRGSRYAKTMLKQKNGSTPISKDACTRLDISLHNKILDLSAVSSKLSIVRNKKTVSCGDVISAIKLASSDHVAEFLKKSLDTLKSKKVKKSKTGAVSED